MSPLTGKCIIVTGAAQGIGAGVAQVLAGDGASVVLVDRDARALEAAVMSMRHMGLSVEGVTADVSIEEDAARIPEAALDAFGTVDGLVNNAGIVHVARFRDHTIADWERLTRVNLFGTFLCCRAVLPYLTEAGSGSIVNISSIAALGYTTSHVAYASTKAGIIALTRELAVEVMEAGLRANVILPGFIRTDLSSSVSSASGSDLTGLPASPEPLYGKWGTPRDVGELASFLVSDRSQFINGATITIGGGSDAVIAGGS